MAKKDTPSLSILYWNVLAAGWPYSEDNGKPIFVGQTSVGLERIQEILNKLDDFITKHPDIILCLQEVNNPILNQLLPFLSEKGYSYLYQNQDTNNNRSLGVMIAYPNRLKLLEVDYEVPQTFTKEIWVNDLPGKYREAWDKIKLNKHAVLLVITSCLLLIAIIHMLIAKLLGEFNTCIIIIITSTYLFSIIGYEETLDIMARIYKYLSRRK